MNSKASGHALQAELEPRHRCLIYGGAPSRQLPALAATMKEKLEEGFRCLYLNSRPMVAGIQSGLASIGVNVTGELARGSLVLASEPVVSEDGNFDVGLMLRNLEEAVDQALKDGFKGLWATGDMTWEFGSEKNFAKLMEYEYRLEALIARRHELGGICQYHNDTLPGQLTRQALRTHQMLYVNETLSRINPHYIPAFLSSKHLVNSPELDETISALSQASA